MQNAATQISSRSPYAVEAPSPTIAQPAGDISKIFNTALVTSRPTESPDYFAELFSLMQTPEFRAMTASAQRLSEELGISQQEASERIIRSFRKMDRIWTSYLCQEGRERVLNS